MISVSLQKYSVLTYRAITKISDFLCLSNQNWLFIGIFLAR